MPNFRDADIPGLPYSGVRASCARFTITLAALVLVAWPMAARLHADDLSLYTLTTWTARDGLPSSYLLSLGQDRDGYLWVGTSAGLARFDGQQFSSWPRSGAFPSPRPLIHAICPARDGSLWVAAGTDVIRERDGKMTAFTPAQGVPEDTHSLIESHDGTIWAGGADGLARFSGDRWEAVEMPGAPRALIKTIYEDRQRRLWVAAAGRIFLRDGDRFVEVAVSTDGPVRFTERGDAMLVASATTHLSVIDVTTSPRPEPSVSLPIAAGNPPYAFGRASWRDLALPALLDSRGNFWLGTNGGGLLSIDLGEGRVRARYTERDGLSGDLVRALLEDRDGNIWVGTHSGLTRVTPSSIRPVAIQAGATAEDISTVVGDPSGAVWVEAPGALVRIANDTRTVFREEAGARFDRITAMHTDSKGTLWVATGDGGAVRRINGRFEAVALPGDFSRSVISAIASDQHGTVWMYGNRRLLVRRPDTGTTVVDPPREIADTTVLFIFADTKGRLWMACDGARIALYDQGTFRMFTQAQGVPPGDATGIHEDGAGRIWISSDSGLSTIERDRVITLTTANGLPRNRTFFVIGDDQGRIWLGTGSGLVSVEREELEKAIADTGYQLRLRLHDTSDGLRGTPVVRGYPTAARTRDGIWFVMSTGVAVIDPAHLREQLPPPVPRIEQVLVDGRPIDMRDGVTLSSDIASLQIEYAALMLTAPTKVRFRHRLDGVDTQWMDDGDTRRTVYAHLRSGTYRFNVAASGGDGRWTSPVAAWTFVVPPKWYQTRVFYGGTIAALVLALWGAWQLRVRQINRRFADVLRERARVGREIHDTLLQSLVGTSLELDTLAKSEPPPVVLKGELSRIRQQIQHYIGEAQQSIWDLRSPRLESGDLAARLRERAERILQHAGIGLEFSVTGTPRRLAAHVEQQVLRIGMEAVVNAVRHAQARHVRVEVVYEGDSVRLRVTDDGHGFNPDAVTHGGESHWGLSIMRERAEQVGGRFSVVSAPERGTSIEIIAPCGAPA